MVKRFPIRGDAFVASLTGLAGLRVYRTIQSTLPKQDAARSTQVSGYFARTES